jgi:protein ImuB
MELDPPAERIDQVAFCAKTLADDLHQRLSSRGLACLRVAVEAETEHGEQLCRLWRHEGVLGAAGIAERVRWQLDGWLSGGAAARPTGGLARLRLVPDHVVADHGRQLGFWGGDLAAAESAARALARVQAMVGTEAVTLPELVGGRSPAERVALRPVWAGDLAGVAAEDHPRSKSPGTRPGPWPGRIPPPAPGRVPRSPLPAVVTDARGQRLAVSGRGEISGPPAGVAVAGGDVSEIVSWAGPWPADERWWDPAAHRRRARAQVVTASGEAHLLALEAGEWWVEATYD